MEVRHHRSRVFQTGGPPDYTGSSEDEVCCCSVLQVFWLKVLHQRSSVFTCGVGDKWVVFLGLYRLEGLHRRSSQPEPQGHDSNVNYLASNDTIKTRQWRFMGSFSLLKYVFILMASRVG